MLKKINLWLLTPFVFTLSGCFALQVTPPEETWVILRYRAGLWHVAGMLND